MGVSTARDPFRENATWPPGSRSPGARATARSARPSGASPDESRGELSHSVGCTGRTESLSYQLETLALPPRHGIALIEQRQHAIREHIGCGARLQELRRDLIPGDEIDQPHPGHLYEPECNE